MLADIAERQVTAIHPQHDEWPRDAEDGRGLGWAQLLIFGKDCHPLAAEQPGKQGLDDVGGDRRQRDGLLLAVTTPDMQLDAIAIRQFRQARDLLTVLVRKAGELDGLAGHSMSSLPTNIGGVRPTEITERWRACRREPIPGQAGAPRYAVCFSSYSRSTLSSCSSSREAISSQVRVTASFNASSICT